MEWTDEQVKAAIQNAQLELEYLDLYKIDHNILLTNDDATNRSLLNTQLLTLPLNSALLVTVTDNYGTTPLKYNGNNLKQGDILLKTQSGTIYYIAAPQTGIWYPVLSNNTITWTYAATTSAANTNSVTVNIQKMGGLTKQVIADSDFPIDTTILHSIRFYAQDGENIYWSYPLQINKDSVPSYIDKIITIK